MRKQSWSDIAGTELPIYTWIPNKFELANSADKNGFSNKREIIGWYKNTKESEEIYYPLFEQEVNEDVN